MSSWPPEPPIDKLFAALYPELRRLARSRLRQRSSITLLDTTSLVHESYLRFLKGGQIHIEDKAHFLAYAAHVMRSVIVDYARSRLSLRQGGGGIRVPLNTDIPQPAEGEVEILRIHEALDYLAGISGRLARVVEMRYFGGMTEVDIAGALGLTERTVRRDWEKARILLASALK